MKCFLVLIGLVFVVNQNVFAAMECTFELEKGRARTFSIHPKTMDKMKSHADIFQKQENPSKDLLRASIKYQAAFKNIPEMEKTWTLLQREFCERYILFLEKASENNPLLSPEYNVFFHYPENFLDTFSMRLYFSNKENVAAYHGLTDIYAASCVKVKADIIFQKEIINFTQEYSKKYYVTFWPFLNSFQEYQKSFYKAQPSYLEAALSFICCFPISKL